jgi:hypothetical protein
VNQPPHVHHPATTSPAASTHHVPAVNGHQHMSVGTWCQRWRTGQHSWRHTSEGGFDPTRYTVLACEQAAPVKAFIERHHYSHSFASAVRRYALIDRWPEPDPDVQWLAGGQLVGVMTLGSPMNKHVLTGPFPKLAPYRQSLELNRLVLLDRVPANAESWFCARAFRLAARCGLRGLVAYSDPVGRHRITPAGIEVLMPGHLGHVYAVLGAAQLKRGRARPLTLLPDATTLVERSACKITGGERGRGGVVARLVALGAPAPNPGQDPAAWLAHALKLVDAVEFDHPGNYKFAFRLGSRRQRRRLYLVGEIDGPYPTVRPPSVAVPTAQVPR